MSTNYLNIDRPRKLLKTTLASAVGIYLLLWIAAHWAAWIYGPARTAAAEGPAAEQNPVFPDPRVVHATAVNLPNLILSVPYQAADYEIAEILPAELALEYRTREQRRRARIVVFSVPLLERWKLLAPFPASLIIQSEWNADDLYRLLQTPDKPRWSYHLLPWKLITWTLRHQLKYLIDTEGGKSRLARLWKITGQDQSIVGREYAPADGPGQLWAVTVFGYHRSADMNFAFNGADTDNLALVRAFLEGVDLSRRNRPDNEAGLQNCQNLQDADPGQAAMRVCQELYLTAQWLNFPENPFHTRRLIEFYRLEKNVPGLKLLQAQWELVRGENDESSTLLTEIEAAIAELKNQQRPMAPDETAGESEEP